MRKNTLRKIAFMAVSVALSLKMSLADAAVITLGTLAPAYPINQGTLDITIVGKEFIANPATKATQGSLGGGLDISWNANVLQLTGVTRMFSPINDYWMDEIPGVTTNAVSGISTLAGLSVSSFSGNGAKDFDIAKLSFNFVGKGVSNIALNISDVDVWTDHSGSIDLKPSAVGGSITISSVPLPPALLLFGSSLLGMASFSRRRSATA